eukprot:GEZU01010984.1.p1 GENE.GEZU01010984.1~~GEZU01010984.1.p1  ORF type:complete len:144 (-),score=40.30 GEZU01010984.1:369-800(-)
MLSVVGFDSTTSPIFKTESKACNVPQTIVDEDARCAACILMVMLVNSQQNAAIATAGVKKPRRNRTTKSKAKTKIATSCQALMTTPSVSSPSSSDTDESLKVVIKLGNLNNRTKKTPAANLAAEEKPATPTRKSPRRQVKSDE